MENRICYGLRNVHYALILSERGVMEYARPSPLPGAVSLSLSSVGELSPLYAAGGQRVGAVHHGSGYDGTLELAVIPDDFRRDVLGEVCEDGLIREIAVPQCRRIALLFEFQGDARAVRHVLYNCAVQPPGIEGVTKQEGVDVKTQTLSIAAMPDCNGFVKAKTTPTTPRELYEAWYAWVH